MLLVSFTLSWWCYHWWHTNLYGLPYWAMRSCSLTRCLTSVCLMLHVTLCLRWPGSRNMMFCRASVHSCLCPALVTSNGQRVKNTWDRRWRASECETICNMWYWFLICPGLWVSIITSQLAQNIGTFPAYFATKRFDQWHLLLATHDVLVQQHARWHVHWPAANAAFLYRKFHYRFRPAITGSYWHNAVCAVRSA